MEKNNEFSKIEKIQILKEMKETGLSWDECAENHRLPEMFIINDEDPDEMIEFQGVTIPLAEFQKRYPHRRAVVIR